MENLREFYEEIIAEMPSESNSHRFILKLAERKQREYIQALQDCAENNPTNTAVFRILHKQMSTALHDYSDLVEHTGEEQSQNIFRNTNNAATWRKV